MSDPLLQQVFHLPDFDFNSTCWLLADCLGEVRRWSGAASPLLLTPIAAARRATLVPALVLLARRRRGCPTACLQHPAAPVGRCACAERNPGHLPVVIYIEAKQPDDVAAALGPDAVAAIEALLAASP